ncbi:MAG: hypothetical protein KC468_34165, partial [Myxococcales bacterium]|nr:hypothetical protein [Myxococcales bacterium]
IIDANRLTFADPGPNEGLSWDGTQAKVVVGMADAANDGPLRLINDADGIRLEANTDLLGDLSISGAITAVQRITATIVDATTLNAQNANLTTASIGTLTGPGNRTRVTGELALESDVFRVGAAPVWLRLETIDVLGARWRGGVRVWRDDAGALVTALASS